jgi:hypothetical protein
VLWRAQGDAGGGGVPLRAGKPLSGVKEGAAAVVGEKCEAPAGSAPEALSEAAARCEALPAGVPERGSVGEGGGEVEGAPGVAEAALGLAVAPPAGEAVAPPAGEAEGTPEGEGAAVPAPLRDATGAVRAGLPRAVSEPEARALRVAETLSLGEPEGEALPVGAAQARRRRLQTRARAPRRRRPGRCR